MSDAAYIRNFKKYVFSDPVLEDLDHLEEELYGENDRAAAIMLGAFVETALTAYLKTQLRQDMNSEERRTVYEYDGALGTFSAKISVAYAMAAIGPITRDDLNLIRLIRNGFAHSRKPIKFDDPETAAVCANLHTPDLADAKIPVRGFHREGEPDWSEYSDLTKPQNRYRCAVHTISRKMLKVREQFEMANALAPRVSQLQ